jgi:hypothetical protein
MGFVRLTPLVAALVAAYGLCAQAPQPAPNAPPTKAEPALATPAQAPNAVLAARTALVPPLGLHAIAIVPLDSKISGHAAEVTGALQVYDGRAFIAANGAVSSGSETTRVTLPYRGTLLVCSSTTVKLTADSNVPAGDVPGLLMAMDHGAVEMSFATSRNSDTLLTPDFRILISGPGAADVKVRLGPQGDTCVDNSGANAPYVLVSSVFDGGAYRVQPGQRVMFQHGSLREVVDQEKEPCGCPTDKPKGNEFPLAQSEGLEPMPRPVPTSPSPYPATKAPIAPLVYRSADHQPQPGATTEPAPTPAADASAKPITPGPAPQKKLGFFRRLGHFFGRIFGAE